MSRQRSLGLSRLLCKDGLQSLKASCSGFVLAVLTVTAGNLSAAVCHDIYPFYAGPPGSSPNGRALLVGPDYIYGTTYYGGKSETPDNPGYGVVYRLTYSSTSGTFTEAVLYSFTGGEDGGNPAAGLKMDRAGALYGTASTSNKGKQIGVVFRLMPQLNDTYTYSVIHAFGGENDGTYPNSDLTFGPTGEIYGTTVFGGGECGINNPCQGTVFQLLPPQTPGTGWEENVIYRFTGGADGAMPYAGVAISPVVNSSFNLYGAAYQGGINNFGTVFELSTPASKGSSWTPTTLYQFKGAAMCAADSTMCDGFQPLGGVALTNHGTLLGTTYLGGNGGVAPDTVQGGVIFEVNIAQQEEKVLFNFIGANGANPSDTLVSDRDGSFYGTTGGAQAGLDGSVFKLTPISNTGNYHFTNVYTFTGYPNGEAVLPSIAQGSMGAIFGTTFYGGFGGAGSIFEIDNSLAGGNICGSLSPQPN